MTNTFKEWMREGEQAFYDGLEVHDCPYGLYNEQAQSWRRGWANAKFAESLNKEINDEV